MSVLACNRTGCENVMCDRWSTQHGYICNECAEELETFLSKQDEVEPRLLIESFMESDKREKDFTSVRSAREIVDIEFPIDLGD